MLPPGIENFYHTATVADPITRLTCKKERWHWDDEQQQAFEQIKMLLASAPVLHCPDSESPYCIQTDASNTGLGSVLTQCVDGEERVLEFASRVLTSAECNYSDSERECLAIIWAIRKLRAYVEAEKFTVLTNHSSLTWLCNLRNHNGRLARWALELQGYDCTIKHRPGSQNHVPDALSRMYETEDEIHVSAIQLEEETNDA